MNKVHSLMVGLAVLAGGFVVQAEIVNVAPEGTPAANAPLWGGGSIWQLNNGAKADTFHGDTGLPAGFAYSLDLGQPYPIHELRMYPRQDDCCPDRFSHLRVSVHQDDDAGAIGAEVWGADLFTDGSNPGSAPGTVVKVTLPSAQTGRWVQIKSLADPAPNYALQMTELEVLAEVPAAEVNRAYGTVVTANQALYGSFDPASLVDVNRSTLVHGSTAINPGFAYTINLGVTVSFSRILVYPRQDGIVPERLANYRVSIHRDNQGQIGDEVWKADLHTDGSNAGAEPGTREMLTAELDPQGQFKGQWIRILSLDDPVADYALQIADVEAFGVPEGAATILISKQPAPAAAGLGQTATFAVLATVAGGDSALLTFQWQKDGVNIPDATNATYTTPPVVLEDTGKKYRCVLSYPGSASLPSDEATLRINLAYQAPASANQPIYGGWSIGQIVNGVRGDIVHGAAILSPGFRYEVNLGTPIKMEEIDIFPRQDGCCPDRFSNVRVSVHIDRNGQIGDAVWSVDLFTDGSDAGSGPGVVVKLTADQDPAGKFEGQWVRLETLADPVPDYALQMSELEVFGTLASGTPVIQIIQPPVDTVAAAQRTATFSVGVKLLNGDVSKLTYQWQKDGVNISGANETNYTTAPVLESDTNSRFRCVVAYPGVAGQPSPEAILTVDYNYARGGQAFSNRMLWSSFWSPAMLVNGIRTDVIHGNVQIVPGFAYEINLGGLVAIEQIVVYGRQDDCCPERLANYRVSVHNDGNGQLGELVWQADLHTDGSNTGLEEGKKDVLTAALDPTGQFRGQWIRLQSLEDPVQDYALQMAEVEVYGRLVETPPLRLSISREGGAVVLTWQAGNLESAAQIQGPWNSLTDARSPWSVAPTDSAQFYRLRGQ